MRIIRMRLHTTVSVGVYEKFSTVLWSLWRATMGQDGQLVVNQEKQGWIETLPGTDTEGTCSPSTRHLCHEGEKLSKDTQQELGKPWPQVLRQATHKAQGWPHCTQSCRYAWDLSNPSWQNGHRFTSCSPSHTTSAGTELKLNEEGNSD